MISTKDALNEIKYIVLVDARYVYVSGLKHAIDEHSSV